MPLLSVCLSVCLTQVPLSCVPCRSGSYGTVYKGKVPPGCAQCCKRPPQASMLLYMRVVCSDTVMCARGAGMWHGQEVAVKRVVFQALGQAQEAEGRRLQVSWAPHAYPWGYKPAPASVKRAAIGIGPGARPLRMHMYTWSHRPCLTCDNWPQDHSASQYVCHSYLLPGCAVPV
jgi:hypothetical protein